MSRNATAQISQLRQRNIIRDPPKMRIDQRDACCSNETDGSMPIPWKTSKPLTAFPRPPRRSCTDFEGVTNRVLAATKFAP